MGKEPAFPQLCLCLVNRSAESGEVGCLDAEWRFLFPVIRPARLLLLAERAEQMTTPRGERYPSLGMRVAADEAHQLRVTHGRIHRRANPARAPWSRPPRAPCADPGGR